MGSVRCVTEQDTNDTREAPAIRICSDLLGEGAELAIYDPKVSEAQVAADLGQPAGASAQDRGGWTSSSSVHEAARGADAVLVLTEWSEFSSISWTEIASVMRRPAWVFDARATVDHAAARAVGLQARVVGQG